VTLAALIEEPVVAIMASWGAALAAAAEEELQPMPDPVAAEPACSNPQVVSWLWRSLLAGDLGEALAAAEELRARDGRCDA
jgi:hypothetical protein